MTQRVSTTRERGRPSARAIGRRSVLALSGLAAVGLILRPQAASAATVTVGDLTFEVPSDVAVATDTQTFGRGWQWTGRSAGSTSSTGPAAMTVLARADLPSTDAQEILGLVLAGMVTGALPGLTLDVARTRVGAGGGQQTRVNLAYGSDAAARYHGTLLIAVRASAPAALVAVLGDDSLSAGRTDAVLDSVRWLR